MHFKKNPGQGFLSDFVLHGGSVLGKDPDGDPHVGDYLDKAHFNELWGKPNEPIKEAQAIKYNDQLNCVIGALGDQIERIKAYQAWINAETGAEAGTGAEAETGAEAGTGAEAETGAEAGAEGEGEAQQSPQKKAKVDGSINNDEANAMIIKIIRESTFGKKADAVLNDKEKGLKYDELCEAVRMNGGESYIWEEMQEYFKGMWGRKLPDL